MGLGRNLSKEADVRTSFSRRLGLAADWCDVAQLTVDMLPDVALLRIFDFYREITDSEWRVLVQVCRKWRIVVFGSPRCLRLQLNITPRTPVKETLDVWPPLPINIEVDALGEDEGVDNILAALKHNDRTCEIILNNVPSSQLETILSELQKPFPTLSSLCIFSIHETAPVQPDSFLGGSAPSLRALILKFIPFPGLPKLLLSATSLVSLDLRYNHHSGYISPEALVTSLSVLTRLKCLFIDFDSPLSHPDWKGHRPLPLTRPLLPDLASLWFKGASKYLEYLVARIDAPLLHDLAITFFHQQIFDTPQFAQFLSRTLNKALDKARVVLGPDSLLVTLPPSFDGGLRVYLAFSHSQSDWLLLSLAQICSSSLPQALIQAVEHLYISDSRPPLHRRDDIESNRWLEVLHPFTAVKGLYISREFMPSITPALQELVGERVTEVLPALQTLFLEEPLSSESGPVQETIGQFVAARQLAGRPTAISCWEGKVGDQ